jgi:hypothetical protein
MGILADRAVYVYDLAEKKGGSEIITRNQVHTPNRAEGFSRGLRLI